VTIVDDAGEPVPDGEIGDIVVTSRFIALGYWHESEHCVASFPNDPDDPSARVFATGDRARRRSDGLIEFVGRSDERIKLHGNRIEPGEVESALTALPEVSEAAVVVRRGENGIALAIVAYVVLRSSRIELPARHVQAMLAKRLPHYMIPSKIYMVGELPRLPNFKIDRRVLARIDSEQANKIPQHHDDPLVHEVAEVFKSVIGVDFATPEDNVASLGGDSFQAVKVALGLEERFGVVFAPRIFEIHQTIGALAEWIASRMEQPPLADRGRVDPTGRSAAS
jgi:acyl carrier protein